MGKSKQSKAKNFTPETIEKIIERDGDCIFCKSEFWPGGDDYMKSIKDIAHIVNKSQGGLGIEENGVLACRHHHHLLDNGNQGCREEMQQYINSYMQDQYDGWNREMLLYNKYK